VTATAPTQALVVASPFPLYALSQVYQWSLPVWNAVANDDIPRDYAGWAAWQARMLAQPNVRTFGVWRRGELGGFIWAAIDGHIARPHLVFKRGFWGRATTLEAVRQVGAQLFAGGVLKVEIWCWADNRRARSLARAAGAIEEGILTAQGWRDGQLVDCAVFGLTKAQLR
jgi:RimJ/RimL family protein N-acetyltransferase